MDQNILREYLVALGFKVDPVSQKKFGDGLTSMDKRASNLGKSLLGVAASTQAMVTIFASQMEKLYYSAKLANTSAAQMQGIDFGAKQVGIKGMQDALITFASSLRANPGMVKLLEDLVGVPVKGLSTADQLKLLAAQLNKMPNYLANVYGAKFGLSPDMVFLLRDGGLERMQEQEARYAQLAAGLGLNLDEANKAGLIYAQTWRDIVAQVDMFQKLLVVHLLPEMQDLAIYAQHILQSWAAILNLPRGRFLADMKEAIGYSDPEGGGVKLSKEAQARIDAQETQDSNTRTIEKGLEPPKSYSQMTDEERVASGKAERRDTRMFGGRIGSVTIRPNWDALTPAERRELNLPATEEEKPWDWKAMDKWNRLFEKPAEMAGLTSVHPEGGVELSDQSKERLGKSRLQSSAPTPLQSGLYGLAGKLGYQPKPKTPTDPAAIAAVNAPDPVIAQREAKLQQNPDLRAQLLEALRKGDYQLATSITSSLDELADVKLTAPVPARSAPVTPGITAEEYKRALAARAGQPSAPVLPPPANEGAHPAPFNDQQSFLNKLEDKYALPKGLMDRVWGAESGRGANKVGRLLKIDKEGKPLNQGAPGREPDRAMGDFQFTTPTARDYGIRDRMDFKQSADGAAHYMADLVKKYADLRLAAAAYNWGPQKVDTLLARTMEQHQDWTQARVDQYALGHLPKETEKYVEQVAGSAQPVHIEAHTTIVVQGATDPTATGAAVAREQETVNADLVRQFKQRVQ